MFWCCRSFFLCCCVQWNKVILSSVSGRLLTQSDVWLIDLLISWLVDESIIRKIIRTCFKNWSVWFQLQSRLPVSSETFINNRSGNWSGDQWMTRVIISCSRVCVCADCVRGSDQVWQVCVMRLLWQTVPSVWAQSSVSALLLLLGAVNQAPLSGQLTNGPIRWECCDWSVSVRR